MRAGQILIQYLTFTKASMFTTVLGTNTPNYHMIKYKISAIGRESRDVCGLLKKMAQIYNLRKYLK